MIPRKKNGDSVSVNWERRKIVQAYDVELVMVWATVASSHQDLPSCRVEYVSEFFTHKAEKGVLIQSQFPQLGKC